MIVYVKTFKLLLIIAITLGLFNYCNKQNEGNIEKAKELAIASMDGFGILELIQGEDKINYDTRSTRVTSFGSNPGNLNMYVYIPANMPPNAPLVVVLHGCSQRAKAYEQGAGWNGLADLWKFYIIYPEQKSDNNPAYCFNWAGEYGDPANLIRGQGENLSIKQMVDYMKANYSIDSNRVFITGLSAGGAFAVVMLATWPDVFKAGAIMAGVPYRCATDVNGAFECTNPGRDKTPQEWGNLVRNAYSGYTSPYPKVSIWHGDADTTVYPINQRELMEQWTNVHGTDQIPDIETTVNGYPYKAYKNASGDIVVETYTITGMQHGIAIDPQWNYPNSTKPCGKLGAFILDTNICSTYYIAKFFGLD
jgi:poly(hydroxyalkanoate) depolymerase family esterase